MSKVFSLAAIGLLALCGGASVLAAETGSPAAPTPGAAPAALPAASAAAAVGGPAVSGPAAGGPAVSGPADPRIALLKLLPAGSKIEDLKPSPIPGIYEFSQDAEVSYLTADGRYFLDGNLYDMRTRENLTEELRTHARVAMLAAVPESEMLIFSPPNPKYTITVFTDVDCPYCRKLHSDMAELNRLGVRVRYMFFPRTGPNTESWRKAEVVWCSANRNDALTRAKMGVPMDMNKTCGQTPVAREYALGESIGVRGTPAIVTEGGDYIAGYMPPKELVAQLKELEGSKR